ncbi:DUF134 domain-containing protein [Anaerotignum sp.]|uniref:DUF134 domain-containing protein n=1 Tax=Anaerotignum sp. TaxID=2039241 RepID=UPI002F3E46D4
MARPRKCRKVCALPENCGFAPMKEMNDENRVIMAVDEYETIRLIDLVGYTQEECAAQMHIARTTVQGIYNDARRKLADALVNGKSLHMKAAISTFARGIACIVGRNAKNSVIKKEK